MKLIRECVRDTMLYLEDNLKLNDFVSSDSISIPKYKQDDITYTISKLEEAGYINAVSRSYDDEIFYYINSITWNGHQFLDNIRDNKVWSKTKSILSKLESVSIEIISSTAAQVVTNIISKQIS